VTLLLAKTIGTVLKAVLTARWYSRGTLNNRWLLTADKAAAIRRARS
jgi:hypothetical protein